MIITKEPHEELEIKPDYNNESMFLIQRRRARVMDEWNIKVMILSKREGEAIARAITNNILSPKRYSLASLRR